MAAAPPQGDPAPADGSLPESALLGLGDRPFGVYVHVPFCATRCGYCDFNTYTAGELGTSASPASWLAGLRQELDLAARVLGAPPVADTVFVGGGTPSLLGADGLSQVLDAVRSVFGLAPGAEVTTESNPESTSPEFFAGIAEAGYTRVSLGMQSAAQHVLAILDRTHTPGRAVAAAREATAAGIEHVNLDLIYGTPGERPQDLAASLDAVLAAGVDHVSAYSLIVEDGTALARRVRRGELPMPDDDVLADRYEQVDRAMGAAGLHWYEVSNWAASDAARCRHNLGYWLGGDWWGAGPGAHSHVGGVRWWNVKHPARYTSLLAEGSSPAAARERLTEDDQRLERVLLELRLAEGLAVDALTPAGQVEAQYAAGDGLLDPAALTAGRCVLTDRGRLLADAVVRRLT
ncbi:radical SAM family heme chaperone HemW [Actinokineospora globicatena]|uniref:Heme chaperone HemW n=1 Tax=Actinokineospora globicatena TaxID=103729 RepID=A0A9W6QRW2_9PSEU|nr:radical SAM family heme chaperone HemW [Actinokineospora globicatena]MCP2305300.1 coproporphyrinogen III oxidase, anaerobic [Actinokineospora globicatena]GLW80777.1 coproporphyrinogen III oxidase [Actinokineospora globicatena]GLW87604.1 coproporphyrinogen III oxidase [Actinokineospora globicatena]GLW93673.1 coproporphyrinogen III oxidase [Actinokineospora globicatena]